MILSELKLVLSILENFRNYECCFENLMIEETEEAIKLIQREIKLKEMDPRK